MALLTKDKFESLANKQSKFSISIYIPTHRQGENDDSKIRLKNQISEVKEKLEAQDVKPQEIKAYLQPVRDLLEDAKTWRYLSDSLVILRSADEFFYTSLPIKTGEINMVSERYYLLPMLSIFNNTDRFFLLQLSLKQVRLFEATQHEIAPIDTKGKLPESIEDAIGRDWEQKNLQFRTNQGGEGHGMYHGHGDGKDDKKTEIRKFMQEVDQGLSKIIEGYKTPLVIASVEYVGSIFRQVCDYNNVYPQPLTGNFDHEDPKLIHERACEILEPYFERIRNEKREKYYSKSDKTTDKIEELVVAADAGNVDTLFLQRGKKANGIYKPETGEVRMDGNGEQKLDNCLLDRAACETFLKGGKVFIEDEEDMPVKEADINAILRY